MSKARKLPSGKWNCKAYVKRSDGTIERPSFTASTKAEAERLARVYETKKAQLEDVRNMTVATAIETYLAAKKDVLSPSTYADYKHKADMYFEGIGKRKLYDLRSSDMQLFVSSLYDGGRSTKTAKNIYGLLTAAIAFQAPDLHFHVMFRAPDAVKQTLPTDDDVSRLLSAASPELKKAIILSALGTLRRGECCALKYADVSKDHVYVHADLVMDEDGAWIYKEHPKTSHSVRSVPLPAEAITELGTGQPDDYVVGAMPNAISDRFRRLRDKLGMSFRFHDLRAYAASVMEYLGMPKTYIQSVGGWQPGSMVLDKRYLRPMQDKQKEMLSLTSAYFSKNVLSEKSGNESGNEVPQSQ